QPTADQREMAALLHAGSHGLLVARLGGGGGGRFPRGTCPPATGRTPSPGTRGCPLSASSCCTSRPGKFVHNAATWQPPSAAHWPLVGVARCRRSGSCPPRSWQGRSQDAA